MRSLLLLIALACTVQAAEPKIVRRSPAPKAPVVVTPPPSALPPIPVGGFDWYGLDDHTVPITWELEGDAGKLFELTKAVSTIDWSDPSKDPVVTEISAGSVLVRGLKVGKVKVSAWGVVDGRAKRLATLLLDIGPQPPPLVPPITPPVTPPITDPPAAGNRLFFLFVGPDNPTPPEVYECLKLSAWEDAIKDDTVKYLPLSKVPSKDGKSPLPDGTKLPCLLLLSEGPASSKIILPVRGIPKTDAEVNELKKVKP